MDSLVSIIVPVYNTNLDVFQSCLQSILKQTYSSCEVIVIDDGSEEECSAAIEEQCRKDDRIHYYKTENHGVSAARNYGVKKASGDYVTFVDSDDEITVRFLEEAVKILDITGSEIVIGGLAEDNERYEIKPFQTSCIHIVREKEKSGFIPHLIHDWIIFDSGGHINRGPVARVLKRDLALDKPFDERVRIGEDMIWNLSVINSLEFFVYAERVWYVYHYNSASATHKFNPNIIEDEKTELDTLAQQIDFSEDGEYVAYHNHIFECLKRVFDCYIKHIWDNSEKRNVVQEELYSAAPWNMLLNQRYIKTADMKHKIKALMYKRKMLFLAWRLKELLKNDN